MTTRYFFNTKIKILLFLVPASFFLSCSNDDNGRNRNPYLLDIGFSISLNTNLPQYSDLQFPGNAIYVPNAGYRGVFVVNTGSGYLAWEASDPNHTVNSKCPYMNLDGIDVTCSCDDTTYNLYTGLAVGESKEYPLLSYRASLSGNEIIVSN